MEYKGNGLMRKVADGAEQRNILTDGLYGSKLLRIWKERQELQRKMDLRKCHRYVQGPMRHIYQDSKDCLKIVAKIVLELPIVLECI